MRKSVNISGAINEKDLESCLMNYEEYAKIEAGKSHTDNPYVYEVTFGDARVTYFGCDHSNNPKSLMYAKLTEMLERIKPDLILIEGMNNFEKNKEVVKKFIKGKKDEEIIKLRGEPTFVFSKALENNIDIDSPEPDFSDELRHLEVRGFSREEIFVWEMTRIIYQYSRLENPPKLEDYLKRYRDGFKEASQWRGFDYSFESYKKLYAKILERDFNLTDQDYLASLIDPIPWEGKDLTVINRIVAESGRYRDLHIIKEIREKIKNRKNIFIVFGTTHAIMQEPALRFLANK